MIEFSVPKMTNVKLSVFNSLGQEIAVLVNDIKAAGHYRVSFRAKDLSSGIYFYKLKSGNTEILKKMILMK